jgi:hypothetical protein
MIEYHQHPTDPNLVILKTTPRYIGKHSDEDLKAAVLAEREACAKLCDLFARSSANVPSRYEFMGESAQECANLIRARKEFT